MTETPFWCSVPTRGVWWGRPSCLPRLRAGKNACPTQEKPDSPSRPLHRRLTARRLAGQQRPLLLGAVGLVLVLHDLQHVRVAPRVDESVLALLQVWRDGD